MATGRLGTNAPSSTSTYTPVYIVPPVTYSVFNVSFTNTNATAVTIRLALSTSASTPNANEVLEYDTVIVPKGVFERTGLVAQAGLYVLGYVSATGVNINVYGIETSTA
jgi:hypothetical protein